MLDSIDFKAGPVPGGPVLRLKSSSVTVFVGPNNSGKSVALNELWQFVHAPHVTPAQRKVLGPIKFSGLSAASIRDVESKFLAPYVDLPKPPGQMGSHYQISSFTTWLDREQLIDLLANPYKDVNGYSERYARYRAIKLDGATRLTLLGGSEAGSMSAPPRTALQAMWRDAKKRKSWREIVHRAFGFYPYIDPTDVGKLSVRISAMEPDEEHERTFLEKAVAFQKKSFSIDEYSDGVKAFVGIVMTVLAGDHELVLIDEPEAFLHPGLAFILGRELTRYLNHGSSTGVRTPQMIVATHSPNFLMGCVQAKAHVDVVRLTYESGIGGARLLPANELCTMMRKPILRSANALAGVFFNCAVVGEADADRAFYQEINERLSEGGADRGIENCLFLNANGKDTISELVNPLRRIGIPTVAVADIDVFKQGKTCWSKFMDACNVPKQDRPTFESGRALANKYLSAKREDYQTGGVSLLRGGEREAVENLIARLEVYGFFVVSEGEVEFWLSSLDVPRNKSWLHKIFEKLGDDPATAEYVRAGEGDVWAFLGRMKTWLTNPDRKGMMEFIEQETGMDLIAK